MSVSAAPAQLALPGKSASVERRRLTPEDFQFGRLIGEGSFSYVFLAREVSTGKEFAVKVCEKTLIAKEKKTEYIKQEKEIMVRIGLKWKEACPFFVRLYSTFTDSMRIYFVMTYAKNGDFLRFIGKMAQNNDIACIRFYAGELLAAIEFLHQNGILHRDLKPENILLNEKMHILITDFGSAKLLPDGHLDGGEDDDDDDLCGPPMPKRKSFVGTAQYVSPEILTARGSFRASDLWAYGCILYQMMTDMSPFQSQSEYLIFQKIQKLEYSFHEGFDENAKDLIQKLLVIEHTERLGAKDTTFYSSIRSHPFFKGLNFDRLPESTPPSITPFVAKENNPDPVWNRNPNIKPGSDRLNRLLIDEEEDDREDLNRLLRGDLENRQDTPSHQNKQRRNIVDLTDEERQKLLEDQRLNNKYHRFVGNNLIIKQGIIDKKKGLWARRRMFLLTEGPHLYYIDPDNMVLKGEIPWCPTLRPEVRDFKIFFVHTPNRVYYLIDPESTSKDWCHAIQEVKKFYYGEDEVQE